MQLELSNFKAYNQSVGLMGTSQVMRTWLFKEEFNLIHRNTDATDVTNKIEYLQVYKTFYKFIDFKYKNSNDRTPAHLGGKNNEWRALSPECTISINHIIYDFKIFTRESLLVH